MYNNFFAISGYKLHTWYEAWSKVSTFVKLEEFYPHPHSSE